MALKFTGNESSFEIIKDQIDSQTQDGVKSPKSIPEVSYNFKEQDATENVTAAPIKTQVPWAVRFFTEQYTSSDTIIDSTSFDTSIDDIFYNTIWSSDDTLFYSAGVDGINAHFVTNITVKQDALINIPIKFGSSINVIFNGKSQVVAGGAGTRNIPLSFSVDGYEGGYNKLEIYFYGHTTSSYLEVDYSALQPIIEGVRIPALTPVTTPTNFVAEVDEAVVNIGESNANILHWDPVESENLDGYMVQFRGPYNPYLVKPSGVGIALVPTSGNLSAGTFYGYGITAVNPNGETLPFYATLQIDSIDSPSISGLSPIVKSGGLLSGVYSYGIAGSYLDGTETLASITSVDVSASSQANSVELTWEEIGSNDATIKPSGYKIYRSDSEGVFASSSLVADLPITSGTYYTDTGITSLDVGTPPTSTTLNDTFAIELSWTASKSADDYTIYRSNFQPGFPQYATVISGLNAVSFLDNVADADLALGAPIQYDDLVTIDKNTEIYNHTGTKYNRQYDYKISSLNQDGQKSDWSDAATVVAGISTAVNILPQASGITAQGFNRYILVSWNYPTEPNYNTTNVYEGTNISGLFSFVGDSSAGFLNRTGLDSGETKYYRVAHRDISGQVGTQSNVVQATTYAELKGLADISVENSPALSGIFQYTQGETILGTGDIIATAKFAMAPADFISLDFKDKISGSTANNLNEAYELTTLSGLPSGGAPGIDGFTLEATQTDYDNISNINESEYNSVTESFDYKVWDTVGISKADCPAQLYKLNIRNTSSVGPVIVDAKIQTDQLAPKLELQTKSNTAAPDTKVDVLPGNRMAQAFTIDDEAKYTIMPIVSIGKFGVGGGTYDISLYSDTGSNAPDFAAGALASYRLNPDIVVGTNFIMDVPLTSSVLSIDTKYWVVMTAPDNATSGNCLYWNRSPFVNKGTIWNDSWSDASGSNSAITFVVSFNVQTGTFGYLYDVSAKNWVLQNDLAFMGETPGYNQQSLTIPATSVSGYIDSSDNINLLFASTKATLSAAYVSARNNGDSDVFIRAEDSAGVNITLSNPSASTTDTNVWTASGIIDGSYAEGLGLAVASGITPEGAVMEGRVTINIDNVAPASSISINGGDSETISRGVLLDIASSDSGSVVDKVQLSNDNVNWSSYIPYATKMPWVVTALSGIKTVYAKTSDKVGNTSTVFSDSIDYNPVTLPISATQVTYKNDESVSEILDETLDGGVLHTITVSDLGGLDISWTAGEISDRDGEIIVETDAGSGTCTANSLNYLKWVSGTGLTLNTTTVSGNEVLIAAIGCQGGDIHGIHYEPLYRERVGNIRTSLAATFPTIVTRGLSVSADPDVSLALDVILSEGSFYHGLIEPHIQATDIYSRTTQMQRWYQVGGVWTMDSSTQIDPTKYISGGALVATVANKYYRSLFFYDVDGYIGWVYPTAQYDTVAQAIEAACPSMPPGLIGNPVSTCVVMKGSDTAFPTAGGDRWIDVRPVVGLSESAASINTHNNLNGKQGGATDQYYHHDAADYTEVTNWLDDVTLDTNGSIVPVTSGTPTLGTSEFTFGAASLDQLDVYQENLTIHDGNRLSVKGVGTENNLEWYHSTLGILESDGGFKLRQSASDADGYIGLSTNGAIDFHTAANQGILIDFGTNLILRDRDSANAERLSFNSETGSITVGVSGVPSLGVTAGRFNNVYGNNFYGYEFGSIADPIQSLYSNNVVVSGVPVDISGGGGGGTTDHALLTNLPWSGAGHTFDVDLDLNAKAAINLSGINMNSGSSVGVFGGPQISFDGPNSNINLSGINGLGIGSNSPQELVHMDGTGDVALRIQTGEGASQIAQIKFVSPATPGSLAADTVALLNFEQNVTDEAGTYTWTNNGVTFANSVADGATYRTASGGERGTYYGISDNANDDVVSTAVVTETIKTVEYYMHLPAGHNTYKQIVSAFVAAGPTAHFWAQPSEQGYGTRFFTLNGGSTGYFGGSTVDATWYHHAFTFSGVTATMYRNNVSVGTDASTTQPTSCFWIIFGDMTGTNGQTSLMDQFRLSDAVQSGFPTEDPASPAPVITEQASLEWNDNDDRVELNTTNKDVVINAGTGTTDIVGDLTAGTVGADDGFTGTFTNGDAATVTVVKGIITDVS